MVVLNSHQYYIFIIQTFQSVSVLFSEVIKFPEICQKIEPMAVVNLLNSMYTRFDNLTEKNNVYKVSSQTSRWAHQSSH